MASLVKYIKNRLFMKIFLILSAMCLLMLGTVYYFVYGYLNLNFEQESNSLQQQMLVSTYAHIESSIKETTSAIDQLLYNSDIVSFVLLTERASYAKQASVTKIVSDFVRTNPIVSSAYLIVYHQDLILSSNGTQIPYSNLLINSFLNPFSKNAIALNDNPSRNSVLITIDGQAALLQQFPTPEKNGAILAFLDMDNFTQPISNSEVKNIQVVSQTGDLIYPVQEPDADKQQVLPFSIGVTSELTNWSYRVTAPSSGNIPLGTILMLTAPLAIAFLLISLILIANISIYIYKPINKLFQLAIDAESDSGKLAGTDELDFVALSYADALKQRKLMSKQLVEISPAMRERLYKNLVFSKGEYDQAATEEALIASLSQFKVQDQYVVSVVKVINSLGNEFSHIEESLLIKGLKTIIPSISRGLRCEWFAGEDDNLIIIIAFNENENVAVIKNKVISFCRLLQKSIKEMNFKTFLGHSSVVNNISNLAFCYQQAKSQLEYLLFENPSADQSFSDDNSWAKYDDYKKYDEIISLAGEGNRTGASVAIREFIDTAAAQSQNEKELILRFDKFLDTIVEKLISFKVSVEDMQVVENYYATRSYGKTKELCEAFFEAAEGTAALLCNNSQKSSNRYIRQAKEYIAIHYSDSGLSLSDVADYIGINPHYLSRLFYNDSEDGFVETLNKCRIENAKFLLWQSNMPIKEIGFKTGFNSMQSFNRVFKKFTQTTPSAYRKAKEDTK